MGKTSKGVAVMLHNSPRDILDFVRLMRRSTEENAGLEEREAVLDMIDDLATLVRIVIEASEVQEVRGKPKVVPMAVKKGVLS